MTYREAYMQCKTLKELEDMVDNDIKMAMLINSDRVIVIKEEAEYVANLKFKEV